MKILDACCGGKMFWYEKDLDFVTFQDVRAGVKEYSGGRKIRIEPNHVGNVTDMDFEDETFDLVIFRSTAYDPRRKNILAEYKIREVT